MNKKEFQTSSFLSKKHEDITKNHNEMLGFDLPDNYFVQSKSEILNMVSQKEERKHKTFNISSIYKYSIAASVLLFLGLSIWMTFQSNPKVLPTQNSELANFSNIQLTDDEVLIHSLLVEDAKLEQFLDEYIVDKAQAENQLINEKIENMLLNSLLINDSLLDSYLYENITEAIIL